MASSISDEKMSTILENTGSCGKLNVQLLNLLKKHGGTYQIDEDK